MKIFMEEQELLEGYRKLRPESQRLIMSTLITAVNTESATKSALNSAFGNTVRWAEIHYSSEGDM